MTLSTVAAAEEPEAQPLVAPGFDFSFKLEPGLAIPLTAPQSEIYGIGGGQSLKALFGLTSFLDIGPTASVLLLPASRHSAKAGMAWAFGGGLRLKWPHTSELLFGISPWVDADALYVRTGELNRPGFDAALGVSVPIGASRTFWVGPFVRYQHIMQFDRVGYDNHDAKVVLFGISFEVGSGVERRVALADSAPLSEEAAEEPAEDVVTRVVSCPDGDGDDIPDNIDRCPEVLGQMETFGCPPYEKIVVRPDKLELKEKLYFAYDEAKLEDESLPVLDEVVQALKDNKGFRVQVEGHTDSTGAEAHNQTLSERRAEAVLDYLVSHGIAKERLISKGFSSSVPVDSNRTLVGRENNRRVEFVVHFIIIKPESAK